MTQLSTIRTLRNRVMRRKTRYRMILGDENGRIDAGFGKVYVRPYGGANDDGNNQPSIPTTVNAGVSGNYFVYAGSPVIVALNDDNQWTVKEADEAALIDTKVADPKLLNTGRIETRWPTYLRNNWRLMSRSVGQAFASSTLIYVNPFAYIDADYQLTYYGGGQVDLASLIPSAGNHRYAVVFLNTDTNALETYASTTQAMTTALDVTDLQECYDQANTQTIAVQAYNLANNATTIVPTDVRDDLRQFINMPPIYGIINPVVKPTKIVSNRDVDHHGTLTVTSTLTIDGTLTIVEEQPIITKTSIRTDELIVNSTLSIGGGVLENTTRVTSTYTITTTDSVVFANTDSSAYTVTLPAGIEGQTYRIINSGSSANNLTIAPNGAEHLLGANSNFVLMDAEALQITYNATDGWY